MHRVRAIALLIGYVLAGALVNVAVAWLCVSTVELKTAPEQIIITTSPPSAVRIAEGRRSAFGVTQSIRRAMLPTTYGVAGDMYILDFDENAQPLFILKPGETIERDALPRVQTMTTKSPNEMNFIAIEPWMNSAGWPMRSMCCWLENLTGYPSSYVFTYRGTVTLVCGWNPYKNKLDSDAMVLPLQPLWKGFIINTLIYAAALVLPVRGAKWLRSRRRLRRGLCPRCAYPIGSNPVCTECGAVLPITNPRMPSAAL